MKRNFRPNRPHLLADGVLLGVSVLWGTSFAIVKEALAETSPANFLFLRFFFACLLLAPVAWWRRHTWSKEILKPGIIAGLFLFAAFLTQAWGLEYTSASRSGFITGLNVIVVPFFSMLVLGVSPNRPALAGAVLAFLGLYLLTSFDQDQGLPFNLGDFLTLICAVLWAAHIVALGRYSPSADTYWLTLVQLYTACLGSFAAAFFSEKLDLNLGAFIYGAAIYLAIACTLLAYLGQTWAQARTTPTRTAIIFTLEPVFAALFAWIWLGERLGVWGWVGAALVLAGILFAEVKFRF